MSLSNGDKFLFPSEYELFGGESGLQMEGDRNEELIITNADSSHSGNYYCMVDTGFQTGHNYKQYELIVQGIKS